jgi:anti-sigma factor ChrR (cupin superfamily)
MGMGAQEQIFSSPFIRWLLENQEMLKQAGMSNRVAELLQAMMEQAAMTPPSVMLSGAPGMSMEQADPAAFRDLLAQVKTSMMNRRRLSTAMLPFPTMPGAPF